MSNDGNNDNVIEYQMTATMTTPTTNNKQLPMTYGDEKQPTATTSSSLCCGEQLGWWCPC